MLEKLFKKDPVKELKRIIKKDERTDSDYWSMFGNYRVQNLLHEFKRSDWVKLKRNIPSWTSNQNCILADALFYPETTFESVDKAMLYGYIFTIVDDSDADYLIQNIHVLKDSTSLPVELLNSIKSRIEKLRSYTLPIHSVHDYDGYFKLIESMYSNDTNKDQV